MRGLRGFGAVEQEGKVRMPPGALLQYYGDLSSGVIAPEDMRIESLQFRVRINADGTIAEQDDAVQIVSRYNFVLRRVIGFAMNPSVLGTALALIDFNIEEQGRNFTVFKRPVSMAALVQSSGSTSPMEWDGVYITVPGTDLAVTWDIDTTRWPVLVGATAEVGVQLVGDLVACG